jgi:hypothetical protein
VKKRGGQLAANSNWPIRGWETNLKNEIIGNIIVLHPFAWFAIIEGKEAL